MKIPAFFDFFKLKTITLNNSEGVPKNYTGIIKWETARISFYKNGKLHREGGPAIIYTTALRYWYKEGKIHRLDGPAIKYSNKEYDWWIEGENFNTRHFRFLCEKAIFLRKERGKYGFEWFNFLTEERIIEFPIMPGMGKDEYFKEGIQNLSK